MVAKGRFYWGGKPDQAGWRVLNGINLFLLYAAPTTALHRGEGPVHQTPALAVA